jgi:hypothetical protein
MPKLVTENDRVFVEVPEEALVIEATSDALFFMLAGRCRHIDLLPCQWRIELDTANMTEQDCRKVVENISLGGFGRTGEEWKNYTGKALFRTARESLRSKLTSLGMTGRVIILRKNG